MQGYIWSTNGINKVDQVVYKLDRNSLFHLSYKLDHQLISHLTDTYLSTLNI